MALSCHGIVVCASQGESNELSIYSCGPNPSKKGVSTPITAIVVPTALILLASHVATSSFAAIDAMGLPPIEQELGGSDPLLRRIAVPV
jgi:hypothetical protein